MKKKKANPYDPEYIMKRDNCSYEEAMNTIQGMKDKNAWNKGKKLTNRANPYDPEYIMKRDNCSYEEAVEFIAQYKASKATNLENFITKYGQEKGIEKYTQWKSKSLATGWEIARQNGSSQSKFSKDFYLRKGHNEEDAIQLALEFQYENSPLHIQYYIKRGKPIDYARKKIRKIHDKKIGRDCYREFLEKQGLSPDKIDEIIKESRGHCSRENLGDDEFEKRMAKTREKFEANGLWIPLENMSDYDLYRRQVWAHTNSNDLTVLENFDRRARAGTDGGYHLDHRYSISQGYINGIPPDIIGSIRNLEFKTWEENVRKQGNCDITLEDLINED